MDNLSKTLGKHHVNIKNHLHIGQANWDVLIKKISQFEKKKTDRKREFKDEQVWTFLVCCGYAIAGYKGVKKLEYILTGIDYMEINHHKIWFEVLPISPRKEEGETQLDLAVGTIHARMESESGIELDDVTSPWICFCEMKWYSDIDTKVKHDITRNQLIRVIENALCFQINNKYAEKVYVILVTPKIFLDAKLKSRLFQYKFNEYKEDQTLIEKDIEACCSEKNDKVLWQYPNDVGQRIKNLILRWVTYDELFESLPDSEIKMNLKNFWKQYSYQFLPKQKTEKINF
jgi:hypothetical protein